MMDTLLVAGTASHVGKSTVVAGLCRLLADRGVDVVPYKAQNMSNNARVAVSPAGSWGEIGVSQYVQARAARATPRTDMNPVLLKPRGDGESQLVIDGRAIRHVGSRSYYDTEWDRATDAARSAFQRLARDHEAVIAEGAGSIAEINLHDRDLANVETARFADARILLLTDIERGGAFASLVGTWDLMPPDLKDRVAGIAITKFRGDRGLLDPGVEAVESRTGIPVVGILPFDDPGLPEEDSVSLPAAGESAVIGTDDGVTADRTVTIAVPRLERISNISDLDPLAAEPGVRVSIQPPTAGLDRADAVVLPGTKNTVDDLLELREAGFDRAVAEFDGPIIGLCGGYQLLGDRLTNASIEGTGDEEVVEGFGRLPVETRFNEDKRVERITRTLRGVGPLAGASGPVTGYEIHMGETVATGPVERPFDGEGASEGLVLGTYLHGLFENERARDAFLDKVFEWAGRTRPSGPVDGPSPYEKAAALVRDHLDLSALDSDPLRYH